MAQGRECQPAFSDIIQAVIGNRAAPRRALGESDIVLNGGHA